MHRPQISLPKCRLLSLATFAFFLLIHLSAGALTTDTWLLNPTNSDFNTAANWSTGQVPSVNDVATFDISNVTDISISGGRILGGVTFTPRASNYTLTVLPPVICEISGQGLIDQSDASENFIIASDETGAAGSFVLSLSASITGSPTFTNEPAIVAGGSAGDTEFVDSARMGAATIVNVGAEVSDATGGLLQMANNALAQSATITNEAGSVRGAGGGTTLLLQSSSAGDAIITSEGASVEGAFGGVTMFQSTSRAANSTLIALGGTNGGGGGLIQFQGSSLGITSRIEVFGNGTLDISTLGTSNLSIGSLEGDGVVTLGDNSLMIGATNLSTTFSGTIGGTAGITKLGSGTLILSGRFSTYTGGTTVTAGTLQIANRNTPTGTGPVTVTTGVLSGNGHIFGAVTVGTDAGTAASLAPSAGGTKPAELSIRSQLTFKTQATYSCQLNTRTAKADKVTANGITINTGAIFSFSPKGNKPLVLGTIFTLINNTAATPISGTFSNLADGSIIQSGVNRFQVNYEGGDGNDLTFTVVP